jgi:hypothetical protein
MSREHLIQRDINAITAAVRCLALSGKANASIGRQFYPAKFCRSI